MGFSRQEYRSGSPVDHILSGPNKQGLAIQTVSVAGWHSWCPGCPTAGPYWAFKPSLAVGCQSTCSHGLRQRPCWSVWEGNLGKAGVNVVWRPRVEVALTSQLQLALLELIYCPWVTVHHGANQPPKSRWIQSAVVRAHLTPVMFQRPHLQISSYWGWSLQHVNFGGTHSVHNTKGEHCFWHQYPK